jgi:tight adherence protein C
MTFLIGAIGVVLVGITGRLVVLAVVLPRLRIKSHLREIADYGFEDGVVQVQGSAVTRLKQTIRATAERLGRMAMVRMPSLKALSSGDLAAAGFYGTTPEVIHGYRVMAGVGIPLIILLLQASGGSLSPTTLLLVVATGVAGWQVPAFVIRKRGSARLDEIDRGLPELNDLLIATIEAGMGFAASLDLVAARFRGPLGEELRLTMKQQSLGISIGQALEDMVERCETPSVRAFVRTATRGESLGMSIGPILRELSTDMRRRRRQAAQEKMQKAPVKMLFPLMFLIFPALMIVLMFPAAYTVMHNVSGL